MSTNPVKTKNVFLAVMLGFFFCALGLLYVSNKWAALSFIFGMVFILVFPTSIFLVMIGNAVLAYSLANRINNGETVN